MTLVSPTRLEKFLEWWRGFTHKKILLYAILGLVVFGSFLFALDRFGKWRDSRDRSKLQANVNVALKELANVKADVTKDKQDEAVAIEKVKEATNTYLEAVNASEASKIETNAALDRLSNTGKSTGNVTAEELERKLANL